MVSHLYRDPHYFTPTLRSQTSKVIIRSRVYISKCAYTVVHAGVVYLSPTVNVERQLISYSLLTMCSTCSSRVSANCLLWAATSLCPLMLCIQVRTHMYSRVSRKLRKCTVYYVQSRSFFYPSYMYFRIDDMYSAQCLKQTHLLYMYMYS